MEGKSDRDHVFAKKDGEEDEDDEFMPSDQEGLILDEDEQEESDIDEFSQHSESDSEDSEIADADDNDQSIDSSSTPADGQSAKEKKSQTDEFTYRPVEGEDIYGRQQGNVAVQSKYVPPARRKDILSQIDEVSSPSTLLLSYLIIVT